MDVPAVPAVAILNITAFPLGLLGASSHHVLWGEAQHARAPSTLDTLGEVVEHCVRVVIFELKL